MPVPLQAYIDYRNAYQRIVTEAQQSPACETGGILVGRTFSLHQGLVLVVVAASGPGTGADRQQHTYAPDIAAHEHELNYWRSQYASYGVDYVGEWHKHPPGNRHPSSGDTMQVHAILNDSNYNLPYGIFTPLVTIEHGTFMLHGYYYPRETMRPEPVACQHTSEEEDIHDMLLYLVGVETQQHIASRDQRNRQMQRGTV